MSPTTTTSRSATDPEECIDCDACVEACPVDAGFAEERLREGWQKYTQINAD
jgi:NAD-dependent dihydropyrimidine dehydrogenase PreA subunit